MDSIEREVTNYMVSTGDSSTEASQAAENIVQGIYLIAFILEIFLLTLVYYNKLHVLVALSF